MRIDDDAVRWDVTHTLVVAHADGRQPRPDRVASRRRAAERAAPLHDHLPALGRPQPRGGRASAWRATLAELYRAEIDATGQPMSPEPFAAIQNAIEHYRVDDILISTLAGEQSKWLEEGLIDRGQGDHRQAGRARRGGSRPRTCAASAERRERGVRA